MSDKKITATPDTSRKVIDISEVTNVEDTLKYDWSDESDDSNCPAIWENFEKKTQNILNKANTDRTINRLITAHYALLYLNHRDFQWAGLAAYASKQIGCAMDHLERIMNISLTNIVNPNAQSEEDKKILGAWDVFGAELMKGNAYKISKYFLDKLAEGNQKLFLDIYPAHLFFIEYGFPKLSKCWNLRNKSMSPQLLNGFKLISHSRLKGGDRLLLRKSVEEMAWHEQIAVLQKVVYDDLKVQAILEINELNLPGADPAKVVMGTGCFDSTGMRTIRLNETGEDNILYDRKDRMQWILGPVSSYYFKMVGSDSHINDLKTLSGILTGADRIL